MKNIAFKPTSLRESYGKICPIQCLPLKSHWDLDEEDLYTHWPGLTWQYDSRISTIPIYASMMPIHPHSYIILRNIQIEPNATNAVCEARICKVSYVGHVHDVVRLCANPTVLTSGGLDRTGLAYERPIIVPLMGCSTDAQWDDGIHVSLTNANIHFTFTIFNLLVNVARRDYIGDDVDWDFLDPQGNIYSPEPCDEIWNNYAQWSGTGTSEVTAWAGRINPPVRARVLGVMLSAVHSANVTGSYVKVQVSLDGSTWTDLLNVTPIPTSETLYKVRAENVKIKWVRVVVNPNDTVNAATVKVYNVLIWA